VAFFWVITPEIVIVSLITQIALLRVTFLDYKFSFFDFIQHL